MKKYEVCVDYTASKIYEVEAEDADQAESIALKQAMEVAPYDELSVTVGYVDEMDEEDENNV
jgi:hypothetical protein